MRENVAAALKLSPDQVSIKATTEEGMGFTGRGEGIAAQAICALVPVMDVISDDMMFGPGPGCAGCKGCGSQ